MEDSETLTDKLEEDLDSSSENEDDAVVASQDIQSTKTIEQYLSQLDRLASSYHQTQKFIPAQTFKEIIKQNFGDANDIQIFKPDKDNRNIFHYLSYALFNSELISVFEL